MEKVKSPTKQDDSHPHTHSHGHSHTHGNAHAHDHSHDGANGHHHPSPDQAVDATLISIGIDIGSATTHFVVSELAVGRRDIRLAGKPEILERTVTYRSPVMLTPYSDADTIDAAAVESFVIAEASAAGVELAGVDTGAVICTGEAAKKRNAAAISERLTAISGNFVCATAGHHLEAVLGAHGSGAAELSRRLDDPVVLIDIGGGTTKRSICHGGRVLGTAAINVGARLIAVDHQHRIIRLEASGAKLAKAAGVDVTLGSVLTGEDLDVIARRMAGHIAWFVGIAPPLPESHELILTDDFGPPPASARHLAMTGGVSDYFYGRTELRTGDLGLELAAALKASLAEWDPLDPGGGIRATVIGAGQYALQVSGDTIAMHGDLRPPLTGLPVCPVDVPWSDLTITTISAAVARAVAEQDPEALCALWFRRSPEAGYSAPRQLGAVLGSALPVQFSGRPAILVMEQNIGRTVGEALRHAAADLDFLCIDEITIGEFDFIDIGAPPRGAAYLPVTVKSLAFGG